MRPRSISTIPVFTTTRTIPDSADADTPNSVPMSRTVTPPVCTTYPLPRSPIEKNASPMSAMSRPRISRLEAGPRITVLALPIVTVSVWPTPVANDWSASPPLCDQLA